MLSLEQISKISQITSLLGGLKESLGLKPRERNRNGEIPWRQIDDLLYALLDERELLLREIASQGSELRRLREALHIHQKFKPKVAGKPDFEDVPLPLDY